MPSGDFARRPSLASAYVYLPTSGTTGTPKIVAYGLDTLLGNARNCISRLQLSAADRVLIPVPLAHMYGLGAALLPAVLLGACVRLVPDANLLNYVQAEQEFEPSVAFLTPSFGHLLLRGGKSARKYRLTVLAGDKAEEQMFTTYEQRHGCTVALYGTTEMGVICAGSPDDDLEDRRCSVGKPVPGVRLAVPGDGAQPFPLRFDHPYGCAGYARDDGNPLKAASLVQDGWYCTPDMGCVDADGRLTLMGRFDDSIKRDGFLVAFADVERALQRLPGIERVMVVPGGPTPRGLELVAVCTAASEASIDSANLRRAAREVLPGYAVPDRFLFVEHLPVSATVKLDRLALAAMVLR